jgi:hypothetical protein
MALVINTELAGPRKVVLVVTGANEQFSDAVVYDVSAATGNVPGSTLETVGIERITYSVNGTEYDAVTLEWDDSVSDPKVLELRGEGEFDFEEIGAFYPSGIVSGTDTGNLLLTTPAVSSGDNFLSLYIVLRKKYA